MHDFLQNINNFIAADSIGFLYKIWLLEQSIVCTTLINDQFNRNTIDNHFHDRINV